MKVWKLLVPFCAMIVVGCASKSGTETDADTSAGSGSSATTSGVGDGSAGSGSALTAEQIATLMKDNVVYFAFDSSELDAASLALVKEHGNYLAQNPGKKAQLQGNTDERGTREYNLGLGERRAVAVKQVMLSRGVSSSQLDVISYGEERPADPGTGEAAWARNRRVVIVYEK